MMAIHHVHCIVVLAVSHGTPDHYVWDIVSDLDLLEAGIRGEVGATAQHLANQPGISVIPTTTPRDGGQLMLAHGVSHLGVSDPDTHRPTGIVSTLDLAGILAWGEA